MAIPELARTEPCRGLLSKLDVIRVIEAIRQLQEKFLVIGRQRVLKDSFSKEKDPDVKDILLRGITSRRFKRDNVLLNNEEDYRIRIGALKDFVEGRLFDPEVKSLMIILTSNAKIHEEVRVAAIDALKLIGDVEPIFYKKYVLHDESTPVRTAAFSALSESFRDRNLAYVAQSAVAQTLIRKGEFSLGFDMFRAAGDVMYGADNIDGIKGLLEMNESKETVSNALKMILADAWDWKQTYFAGSDNMLIGNNNWFVYRLAIAMLKQDGIPLDDLARSSNPVLRRLVGEAKY